MYLSREAFIFFSSSLSIVFFDRPMRLNDPFWARRLAFLTWPLSLATALLSQFGLPCCRLVPAHLIYCFTWLQGVFLFSC